MKLVRETKKILSDNTIAVTATAVRVPIVGGHSEALNVEFTKDFDVNEVRSILQETDGIIVQDNLKNLNIQCLCMLKVKRSICR
jgi:aspartate-semialdehyde dehydrogenase